MRFRIFGGADCPDWILAEIYSLSRISSIKLKTLAQITIHGLIQPPLDLEKAQKLFADSKLDSDLDLKACIACLNYIIFCAVKYNCDSSALHRELQQLGLPREHSTAIKKVTEEVSTNLIVKLKNGSLKINELVGVSVSVCKSTKCAMLALDIRNGEKTLSITPCMVDSIIKDLNSIKKTMSDLNEHSTAFV